MSRIHEALQRADLERGKMRRSRATSRLPIGRKPSPSLAERKPPPAKAELVLENMAQHPWNPSIASFPTLAERGAGRRAVSQPPLAHLPGSL